MKTEDEIKKRIKHLEDKIYPCGISSHIEDYRILSGVLSELMGLKWVLGGEPFQHSDCRYEEEPTHD